MVPSSSASQDMDSSGQRLSVIGAPIDVFGDEHALDEVEVADGFGQHSSVDRIDRQEDLPASRILATSSTQAQSERKSRATRSMDKSAIQASQSALNARHSFSLRHDGETGGRNARIQPTSHRVNRQSNGNSTTINSNLAVPENPFQDASGPSFPYALYPQQNTIPDVEPPSHDPNSITHVGFSGHQDTYQRRIGPEGEEAADMIGPYGHTEQLPPYTRFAGSAVPKVNGSLQRSTLQSHASVTTSVPSYISTDPNNPRIPFDFGGSGQPGRLQESPDLAQSPVLSPRISGPPSGTQPPAQESPLSEKGGIRRKRRLRAILMAHRLVVLGVVVLLVIGVIVGGAVGAAVGRRKAQQQSSSLAAELQYSQTLNVAVAGTTSTSIVEITKTYDAISMSSTPSGVQPLATGYWSLPWALPSQQESGCVDAEESSAWSCAIGNVMSSAISIDLAPDGAKRKLSIGNQPQIPGALPFYGTQAPSGIRNQTLHWVLDSENQSLGPAAFFQGQYDKVVIVPEGDLEVTATRQRRGVDSESDTSARLTFSTRSGMSPPMTAKGDQPWYCVWNDTLVEGFVYVTQNASDSAIPTMSSQPTSSHQHGSAAAAARETGSGSGTEVSHAGSSKSQGQKPPGPPSNEKRGASSSLSNYPMKVKIEERRDPARITITPYCQRMQILDDGSFGIVLDGLNNPIMFSLDEEKGTYKAKGKREVEERDDSARGWSKCQCQWILPMG